MNRYLPLVSLLFFVALAPQAASAQNQQEGENAMLPEIDPQDIEIRSQFRARFPGLRRQPILGFDPTPRVYQIDPNRMPFMETEEQIVANLPVSDLSRPDPPAYTPFHYSSDINAFGRFGMGSYVSPEVKFWGVTRPSTKSYIGGDLDYSSSDGHPEQAQSSFRFLNANGEFATKLDSKTRLGLKAGLQNSFNHLFNLSTSLNVPGVSRKEYGGFHFGSEIQRFQNSISGWKAQGNVRYYDVTLEAGELSGESDEMVYNGSVAKRWAGPRVSETFTLELGVRGGNFNNSAFSDHWLTGQGGVVYERLFNYSTKVTADASVYYGVDSFESKVYFGPSLTVAHPLLDFLTLTVKAGAEPFVKTVEQLHSANRFLNVSTNLRHSYRINGSAEASISYSNLGTLKMGVLYENISDYPVFMRNTNPDSPALPPEYLFYETVYEDIYRARAYASFTHQLIADRFWLNGKMYVQSPKVQNQGRIPFEERFGVNSGMSIRPFDMITLEAWANYVGSRRSSTEEKIGGFLLLGGQLDVEITERFGAYAKLVNLLNQEYQVWQGYTERPFQIFGGLTLKL